MLQPRAMVGLLGCAVLLSCPKPQMIQPPPPPVRCEVDLAALGVFASVGSGATAAQIASADQLIGGEMAHGTVGDYLLENDRIRVIVQRPTRALGPNPYGGTIIDADLKRPAGQSGRDQMGKLSLLYSFGRIINTNLVEVLNDGGRGGYAVIAATGTDAVNDFINLPSVIGGYLPGSAFVTSPDVAVPVKATTYYVLSPGESRVRMLTAFCNSAGENVVIPVGDLFEQGGSTDFFNPAGCMNGMGGVDCLIDPAPWYGFQGDEVAYALRPFQFASPLTPETGNALISFTGVVGTVTGAKDQAGLLTWLDLGATSRPGSFGILPAEQRNYLRDLHLGRDLADITSQFTSLDQLPKARLELTVTMADGTTPAANARVAVISAIDGKQQTLMLTDAMGKARTDLRPGNYSLRTGKPGYALEAATQVTVPSSGSVSASIKFGASRALTVTVRDEKGAGMPAKVTVICPGTSCQYEREDYRPLFDVDRLPSNVAAYEFVGPTGNATIPLPPGQYEVLVSRGPEYSAWPSTFPRSGAPVDLSSADQSVAATLVQVVDTSGWMSADLHVHAVNSADSSVPNAQRVMSYAAEGVDVLVSTDHDVITDYQPVVNQLGLQSTMATMIGCEVSPFDFGHQNAWPLQRTETPNGGAFDWAGGDGPTLRLSQVYAGLKSTFPGAVIQMNHPRGRNGSLSQLKVDTLTLASHADPATYRMEAAPDATAADTKLLSNDFDAVEVMNGPSPNLAVMNDWMTLLSTGRLKVATAVSDSHFAHAVTGGYGRTWVRLPNDTASGFQSAAFAESLKARHAVGSSGPFLRVTAQRLDAGDQPVGTAVGPGDLLALQSGEKVQLTVDVQAPEWMQFDAIELYAHATGRESSNGEENGSWPPGRVLQSKAVNLTMLPLEPVPGTTNGRRVHVVERFTVSPTADDWYVVMVRASTATQPLFPLVIDGVDCKSGTCATPNRYPAAFSNAVLVDVDGNGRYDAPIAGQPLTRVPPKPVAPTPRVPTMEEVTAMLRALLHSD